MKLPPKEYLSFKDVAERWKCSQETIFYYIDNDLLQLSAKVVVFEYKSEKATATMQLPNISPDFEGKWLEIRRKALSKYDDGTPLSPSEISIEILYDAVFDIESKTQKIEAKQHNYEKCFIRLLEIERFEQEHEFTEPEQQTSTLKPNVKRENDFNSCLSEIIEGFIDRNGYPPTIDIVLHELKQNTPTGHIINFSGDTLSINGAQPRKLDNVKRTIKTLLSKL